MKKIMALLLAFCVLSTACQSTKGISENLVAIETPHAADTATHALENVAKQAPAHAKQTTAQVEQIPAHVEQAQFALALGAVYAKQVTTNPDAHTLKSANKHIDENIDENPVAKNSNDKADVLSVVHEGQLDSRDDLISIKITSDKNDTTALLIDTSADIQVKESASDTPMETTTNGQVEPIKISSVTIAEQNNDAQNDDAQKKEEKPAVM